MICNEMIFGQYGWTWRHKKGDNSNSIVLYVLMVFGLGQQRGVAENRSILIASCVLIYMILFGHGLPLQINKMI